jgi:hypothetical protein
MAVYAAYGSNLNPEQMRLRCPHSPVIGGGWLVGWRLTFGGGDDIGWEGALATLVEDAGAQVFVMTYDLTDEDAVELDRWEGVDLELYSKIRLWVQTLDGEPLAWTYVLNAYEGGLPSARYLGMIAEAAERAGAPDDYVRELRGRPCRGVDER